MSWNREHVAWQNENGKWGIGFYKSEFFGSISEDDDPEWDVTYNYGSFEEASTGHETLELAQRHFGGNPGGPQLYSYSKETAEKIEEFELMAKLRNDPKFREEFMEKQQAEWNRKK